MCMTLVRITCIDLEYFFSFNFRIVRLWRDAFGAFFIETIITCGQLNIVSYFKLFSILGD